LYGPSVVRLMFSSTRMNFVGREREASLIKIISV
jgi:hypothetical protein